MKTTKKSKTRKSLKEALPTTLPSVDSNANPIALRGTNALQTQFEGKALPPALLNTVHDNYVKTYNLVTGKAWSFHKFSSYQKNWIFFGTPEGFIAVRPQRLGPLKLVIAAGDPDSPNKDKALLNAFVEILQLKKPIWGLVSPQIAKYITKVSRGAFMTLSGEIISDLLEPYFARVTDSHGNPIDYTFPPIIPEQVISGSPFSVNIQDDGVVVHDDELGDTGLKKFLVDKNWIRFTAKEIINKINSMANSYSRNDIEDRLEKAYLIHLIELIAKLEGLSGESYRNKLTGDVKNLLAIPDQAVMALPEQSEQKRLHKIRMREHKRVSAQTSLESVIALPESKINKIYKSFEILREMGLSLKSAAKSKNTLIQEQIENLAALKCFDMKTKKFSPLAQKLWIRFQNSK
jgi:hypothetical protein